MKRLAALLCLFLFASCGLLTATSAATAERLYREGKITREEYENLTDGTWTRLLEMAGVTIPGMAAATWLAVAKVKRDRGPVAPKVERERRALELHEERQASKPQAPATT